MGKTQKPRTSGPEPNSRSSFHAGHTRNWQSDIQGREAHLASEILTEEKTNIFYSLFRGDPGKMDF